MKAVIVVPYRDDGGARERNWRIAAQWWLGLGLAPIVVGSSPENEPFDITKARNAAVAGATERWPDWDVVLMTDSDVILQFGVQAQAALNIAHETNDYVVAHSAVRYLGEDEMEIVASGWAPALLGDRDLETARLTWETCFAFSREVWETLGGFDPRFRGFGHQVEAFFHAAKTLFGTFRVAGDCYHLWHPYSADQPNPHLAANRALVERYWAASGDRIAMKALLAEYVVNA